jgi:hypothetical protein
MLEGDGEEGRPHRGNSRAHTVSRLRREAPELYEEVRAGRISANAAAIQAGRICVAHFVCRALLRSASEAKFIR